MVDGCSISFGRSRSAHVPRQRAVLPLYSSPSCAPINALAIRVRGTAAIANAEMPEPYWDTKTWLRKTRLGSAVECPYT
jgi:hypothetical protein